MKQESVSSVTHIQSLKLPLGVRYIGVVIGFITPLHYSAALPFAMVDEPLRPLKHGRLRDWGWGKGEKEVGGVRHTVPDHSTSSISCLCDPCTFSASAEGRFLSVLV